MSTSTLASAVFVAVVCSSLVSASAHMSTLVVVHSKANTACLGAPTFWQLIKCSEPACSGCQGVTFTGTGCSRIDSESYRLFCAQSTVIPPPGIQFAGAPDGLGVVAASESSVYIYALNQTRPWVNFDPLYAQCVGGTLMLGSSPSTAPSICPVSVPRTSASSQVFDARSGAVVMLLEPGLVTSVLPPSLGCKKRLGPFAAVLTWSAKLDRVVNKTGALISTLIDTVNGKEADIDGARSSLECEFPDAIQTQCGSRRRDSSMMQDSSELVELFAEFYVLNETDLVLTLSVVLNGSLALQLDDTYRVQNGTLSATEPLNVTMELSWNVSTMTAPRSAPVSTPIVASNPIINGAAPPSLLPVQAPTIQAPTNSPASTGVPGAPATAGNVPTGRAVGSAVASIKTCVSTLFIIAFLVSMLFVA